MSTAKSTTPAKPTHIVKGIDAKRGIHTPLFPGPLAAPNRDHGSTPAGQSGE